MTNHDSQPSIISITGMSALLEKPPIIGKISNQTKSSMGVNAEVVSPLHVGSRPAFRVANT